MRKNRWIYVACIAMSLALVDCSCDDDEDGSDPATTSNATDDTGMGGEDTGVEMDTGTGGEDTGVAMDTGTGGEDVKDDAGSMENPTIEACDEPAALPDRAYAAQIRWTSYGIPHITGSDLGNVAYGQGYAFARDHICILADQIVKVRSERAKYFGAGPNESNIRSDFGWLALGAYEKARCTLDELAPDSRELIAGYVAGYNAWLEETGVDNLPEDCAGADWVQPITELDLNAYYISLAVRASGQPLLNSIADTQAPGSSKPTISHPIPDYRDLGIGSNGWGIGADRTESERGMVIGNPHFPWEGALKLYESHLTVPGELNVYGVSLMGVAGVLIGFNENVAWTHTVSASSRFNLYRMEIDSENDRAYIYDGESRLMSKRDVSIEVLGGETLERTYYYTHYGPMVNVGPLAWSGSLGVSYRDANINNTRLIDQWLAMARASNMEEFKAAHSDVSGVPWVNTMAADREGNAFYIDSTAVPNFSDAALDWWRDAVINDPIIGIAWNSGVFAFEGNTSDHEWVEEEGAREPGLIPYAKMPKLERRDFVANANDSHWLSNPAAPLEGFSPFYGSERAPRTPRTRMNLVMLTEMGDDAITGADGRFSLEELKAVRTSNRAMLAELLRDAVAARCDGVTEVMLDGDAVDISEACALITAWDGRLKTTSVGAIVWREFVDAIAASFGDVVDAGKVFSVGFDPDDPVNTPNTLTDAPGDEDDPVLMALATAVVTLGEASIDLDTPFGAAQYTLKGDERIPVPGGTGIEGAFNITLYRTDTTTLLPAFDTGASINGATGLFEDGYAINYGTSFVFAVEFTEDGPQGEALLTYSQSSDPASPHFADQTRIFGEMGFRPMLYKEEDISNDPNLQTLDLSQDAE